MQLCYDDSPLLKKQSFHCFGVVCFSVYERLRTQTENINF